METMRSSWFFRPGQRSRGVQALWIAFGLIVALFYFTRRMLVSLRIGGWSTDVDLPVEQWVLAHQDPVWHSIAYGLYLWGSTPGMTLTMVVLTAIICFWSRSWWPLATVAFTALGSVLLTIVLKSALQVARPNGVPGGPAPPDSYSFAYLLGGIAVLFVAAMGASRIYISHHWLSDVLVGLLIGAGWAAVVAVLHYFFVPSKRIR